MLAGSDAGRGRRGARPHPPPPRPARRRRHRRPPRRRSPTSSTTAPRSRPSAARATPTAPPTARAARTRARSPPTSPSATRPLAAATARPRGRLRGGPRRPPRARPRRRSRRRVRAPTAPRLGAPGPALGLASGIIAPMKFLRMRPGHGEQLIAEGDPEVVRGRGAPGRDVPPSARRGDVGRRADHHRDRPPRRRRWCARSRRSRGTPTASSSSRARPAARGSDARMTVALCATAIVVLALLWEISPAVAGPPRSTPAAPARRPAAHGDARRL